MDGCFSELDNGVEAVGVWTASGSRVQGSRRTPPRCGAPGCSASRLLAAATKAQALSRNGFFTPIGSSGAPQPVM